MRVVKVLFMTVVLMAASAAADVRVQLHLKRAVAEEVIEREFQERSTPGSAKYQQHLSKSEVARLVRPRPGALEAAQEFLRAPGVQSQYVFDMKDAVSGVVAADSPVAGALGLSAKAFEKSDVRMSVPVPASLAAAVERIVVVPPAKTLRQQRPKGKKSAAMGGGSLPFPGSAQSPPTIYARYALPQTVLTAASSQGVAEFQQSYFNPEWISTFTSQYGLPAPNIKTQGPNSPSQDDVEGTLDLEYIVGLAPGATTWWISSNDTSSDPYGIDFAWMCDNAAKLSPMPTVISISWGIGENNYKSNYGVLMTDNDAFRKLGLMGVSVLAASGDSGPGSRGVSSCTRFDPGWPASSPYVTSVGATYANSASEPEQAVSFSGGGFSDVFPTPSWQQAAVTQYLSSTSNLPKASFYNASGRGFPDVSALGTNFEVFGQNQYGQDTWTPVSGTSCASPTFAAVLTRVNADRVAAGKSTLGFLNPTIYAKGKVGQDVISGASVETECFGIDFPGFPATAGWDPVSGLGTPNYPYLMANL